MDIRPIDANALRKEILGMKYTKECPSFIFTPVGQEIFNSGVESASFAVTNAPALSLNTLRDVIYQDAVAHGLWEGKVLLCDQTDVVTNEVMELLGASSAVTLAETKKAKEKATNHFNEELADIVIGCFSLAGKLGIDIDEAIRRKMEINRQRPWKHGKAE